MKFVADWRVIGELSAAVQTQPIIRDEPMMFSVDPAFAMAHGGPITQEFVRKLLELEPNETDWIIDSRTHMLMPGWFPCIPGWHCDDFYRPAEMKGQPDLWSPPRDHRVHVLSVVGTTAMTEFLAQGEVVDIDPTDIPESENVYGACNRIIEQNTNLRRVRAVSGTMVRFDTHDWHRGMQADDSSWRFFIRASARSGRPALNEIRKQVQVYLPDVGMGW